ncbi:deuterolysin metalloprotease (M35) family domain-containing protein [Pochonia chlamydosporia 170]|uniref:deuterolysin n=1 Tax=Pochonia chlamydosporia 170 TaxID=1380566 RepID=A0A179G4X9_METCM|nr:deuterolysin metalloprotease (M35) family domain-containing protein [Pochonia chlamydosporia 170]OAQ72885.1 deuterolysin metalloprotease (M35) family domain-containing protein [Pochonia chlamydosporia 170]
MRAVILLTTLNQAVVNAMVIGHILSDAQEYTTTEPSIEAHFEFRDSIAPPSNETLTGKRATIKRNCDNRPGAVEEALRGCATSAKAGQAAALDTSSGLLQTFFKSSDAGTRKRVADIFGRIAQECGATGAGTVSVTCQQEINACTGSVAAWALAPGNKVQLCDLAFTSGRGSQCGSLSTSDIVVHEMAHALAGVRDLGYGMGNVLRLDASQSLNNADNFAHFAQAAVLGCKYEGGGGRGSGNQPTNNGGQGVGKTQPPGTSKGRVNGNQPTWGGTGNQQTNNQGGGNGNWPPGNNQGIGNDNQPTGNGGGGRNQPPGNIQGAGDVNQETGGNSGNRLGTNKQEGVKNGKCADGRGKVDNNNEPTGNKGGIPADGDNTPAPDGQGGADQPAGNGGAGETNPPPPNNGGSTGDQQSSDEGVGGGGFQPPGTETELVKVDRRQMDQG